MAKGPKVEKDRSERWLLTYSDLMNLLLILFIILYSMSSIDAAKASAFAEALGKGFNGAFASINSSGSQAGGVSGVLAGDTSSLSSALSATSASATDTEYNEMYENIVSIIKEMGLASQVNVTMNKSGVVISLSNNVLFDSGSAELDSKSVKLIVKIGKALNKVDFSQVIVEGHTDSDPIHNSQYQDNLDLSTARANNVNRILTSKCGIDAGKISSMGYGDTRPVVSNTTNANKAKNRRVVITILKPSLSADATVDTYELNTGETESGSSSADSSEVDSGTAAATSDMPSGS